jgi:HD-GYP domain-containing protein (c-di-GMP phosphodiesterase class II)
MYDGSGYPDRLKGVEIPLHARIVCLADAFDAMTSTRPYRVGLPIEFAMQEMKRMAGIQFCPECVEAFIRVLKTSGVLEGEAVDEAAPVTPPSSGAPGSRRDDPPEDASGPFRDVDLPTGT